MKAIASPNIALIKYWGKKAFQRDSDRNIGCNSSISMTLSLAQTVTEIRKNSKKLDSVTLNGQVANDVTYQKVVKHLNRVAEYLHMERDSFDVVSSNNFPTGTGIASSASAFAALTLAAVAEMAGREKAQELLENFPKELSSLARRGSGSAARSIEGPFMRWDDRFAYKILPEDWTLFDTIVIFDDKAKAISSSEGHERVWTSPLFPLRLERLSERIEKITKALEARDLQAVGPLIEEEAREMHEVMESSTPAIVYRSETCLRFLKALEATRNRDFFWTLDAGPNPHIISQRPIKQELSTILRNEGLRADLWEDKCGLGARLVD